MLRVYIGEHHCDELLSTCISETHSNTHRDRPPRRTEAGAQEYTLGRRIKVYNIRDYLFLCLKLRYVHTF
jgi:hypothetical protein